MCSPLDPIGVGSLEIRNRIAMAPMKTVFGTVDGQVTDRLIAFFRRRAEGGVGLVVSEPFYVDKRGQEHPKQLGIDADDKIDGIRRLVLAIHEEGGKVFAHLNHGGRAANPKAAGGPPEAPSVVVCPRTGCEPVALGTKRINEIVVGFAQAARRAREAGFDGVELQFGLGYLVSQFLSPATNLRSDGYGGDWAKRLRFAGEVFTAVREAVGSGFPIGVRISGSEKAPQGLEIDDAIDLARQLESWGADLIHVATGSNCESPPWYFQHMSLPPGVNEELAARIHDEVSVPVMVAGRLGDPPRIREVIGTGMADMIAVGRGVLADPDLPNKMRAGRDDEVLLCGHCLQGCFANVSSGIGIGCNINPEVGLELEGVEPAERHKRVVVVGGGPAGMQAAITARRRGHKVTLFEKKDHLGGQFVLAFLSPGKQRMEKSLSSLVAVVERSGVEVRLGEMATVDEIKSLAPDMVVIATGSEPAIPDIAGLDSPLRAGEVLSGKRSVSDKVLVIGGGMVGLEVAEYLAAQGKQCVVVEILDEVAADMNPISRKLLLKRLGALQVELQTATEISRVEGRRVFFRHEGDESELGEFDSIVVAIGNRPVDELSAGLRGAGVDVQLAGDSERPAQIYDAVRSGHRAVMNS